MLEIKGDFTQLSSYESTGRYLYERDNFYTSDTHKTILSGTSLQTVSFEDAGPKDSHFNILEIENSSPEGIAFTSAISFADETGEIISDLAVHDYHFSSPLVINGWTLHDDYVWPEADLILTDDTLNLNGKTLTVNGNFTHSGGRLNINGGQLIIKGDYRIQTPTDVAGEYTYSEGYLHMTDPADVVLVEGDFITDSRNSHEYNLRAGVLEIKGNFTQLSSYESTGRYRYEWDNFYTSGTHKTILSGTGLQTVSFEDAGPEASHFNILEVQNSSPEGLAFATPISFTNETGRISTPLAVNNYTFSSPITIKGWTLYEDTVWPAADLILVDNSLNLNGKMLTINGNLTHASSYLNINGGRLIVKGDYRIQTPTEVAGEYTHSTGYFHMRKDADYVLVEGDFVMDSYHSHELYLDAGVLELKGDFTQISTSTERYAYKNFFASRTHTTILSGTGLQTVSFADAKSTASHFNRLELQNTSPEGVTFTSGVSFNNETGGISSPLTSDNYTVNGPVAISGWKLRDDHVWPATDLILTDGYLDLNGKTLTVNGDFIHSGGNLNIGGGRLIVKGDYRIQTPTEVAGEYTYSEGYFYMKNATDYVLVEGNFVIDSRHDHESDLRAGVLEIKGDFTQMSTDDRSTTRYEHKNFFTSGSHTTILSGTGLQNVSFEDAKSNASHFNILALQNTSPEGVAFNSTISFAYETGGMRNLSAASEYTINGSLAFTGWKLQEDYVWPTADIVLTEGSLELNGHTMTVNGNLIHAGGYLRVSGGRLIVKGDYRVQTPTDVTDEYTYSAGYFDMRNAADYVLVEGDFVMDSRYSHENYLQQGVLEIKGDFTQMSTDDAATTRYEQDNFYASREHTTLLSGTGLQTIRFEDPSTGDSHFNILEIQNSSAEGIAFASTASFAYETGELRNVLTASEHTFNSPATLGGWTLQNDYVWPTADIVLTEGSLDLNGNTMTVNGDLIHSGGYLRINGGQLIIKGDYRVQTPTDVAGEYTYSEGYFDMRYPEDYVLVEGDFVMDSRNSHENYLRAGVLEIKGDFTQMSTDDRPTTRYEDRNFQASGTHTTILSGVAPQTYTFEDERSRFNILDIQTTSAIPEYRFSLTKTGPGISRIRPKAEAEWSIDCPTACEQANDDFSAETEILLTAHPKTGYEFTGWQCDNGLTSTQSWWTFVLTQPTNCTANFVLSDDPSFMTFTGQAIGSGNGQLSASGVVLGTQGVTNVPAGQRIHISAKPSDAFSQFTAWSGDCEGNKDAISFIMDTDKTCYAEFTSVSAQVGQQLVSQLADNSDFAATYPLATNQACLQETLNFAMNIMPFVQSHVETQGEWPTELNNIDFYSVPISACTHSLQLTQDGSGDYLQIAAYLQNSAGQTELTLLKSTPATDENSDTSVEVMPVTTVPATTTQYRLQLHKNGFGTSNAKPKADSSWAINCSTACPQAADMFPAATEVLLWASPRRGSEFVRWQCDNGLSSDNKRWSFVLAQATTCTAEFALVNNDPSYSQFTAQRIGTGNGEISVGGVELGTQDTINTWLPSVWVSAEPSDAFSEFKAWSGDCAGNKAAFRLTMDSDKTCYAEFISAADQVGQTMATGLYTDTSFAQQYPQTANAACLQEAMHLAMVVMPYLHSHIQLEGDWPTQFAALDWYTPPILNCTQSLQVVEDAGNHYLQVGVNLQNAASQTELVNLRAAPSVMDGNATLEDWYWSLH